MRVYTLDVYLGPVPRKRPDPPWRKIEIGGNRSLDDLHEAIIDAFDREEETPVYAFFVGKSKGASNKYAPPEGMTTGQERNASETAVDSLQLRAGDHLRYLFNSEWWHVIEVRSIEDRADVFKYPRVLEKHGEESPGWVEYLNSALLFPFEAEVSEYQDEGQLQIGDRLVVKKVTGMDDKYKVIVEARVGRRKFQFPLIDLMLVDEDSPNRVPMDKYRAWFPGD